MSRKSTKSWGEISLAYPVVLFFPLPVGTSYKEPADPGKAALWGQVAYALHQGFLCIPGRI